MVRLGSGARGAPRLNINPNTNETLCISCNLCALACPENLIVVSSVRNEQTRRKDLTTFTTTSRAACSVVLVQREMETHRFLRRCIFVKNPGTAAQSVSFLTLLDAGGHRVSTANSS
jgi:ferredoxin